MQAPRVFFDSWSPDSASHGTCTALFHKYGRSLRPTTVSVMGTIPLAGLFTNCPSINFEVKVKVKVTTSTYRCSPVSAIGACLSLAVPPMQLDELLPSSPFQSCLLPHPFPPSSPPILPFSSFSCPVSEPVPILCPLIQSDNTRSAQSPARGPGESRSHAAAITGRSRFKSCIIADHFSGPGGAISPVCVSGQ